MVLSGKTMLKHVFLLTVFLAGILAGLFLWDRIELSFENPWGIVSELTALQYNPANNLLRFIVLMSLPAALLLAIYLFKSRRINDLCFGAGDRAKGADHTPVLSPAGKTMLVLGMVTVACLVGVTVTTFGSSGTFDTFHEGETLGPAISYVHGKIPYKDFLFWKGVIQDPLRSVIAFNLFGRSIGAVRTLDSILKILQILLFAFFMRKIYGGDYLSVALTFIALIVLYNIMTLLPFAYLKQLASRDIITFSFLMTVPFLHSRIMERHRAPVLHKLIAANFLFSFIPVASFAYSIDRAFFLGATFLVLSPVIYLSFFHRHRLRIPYLASSLAGVLAGLLVLGLLLREGFWDFLTFTFRIVPHYKDLLDGKVYPIHSLPGLTCTILIAANTYWVTLQFLRVLQSNNGNVLRTLPAFLEMYLTELCLLLLSIFIFRGALGRSDVGHVVYNSYLSSILFIYIVVKHYLPHLLQRPGYRTRCSYGAVSVMILFSGVCLYRIYTWNLITYNFPVMVSDSRIIPEHYKATIAFLKNNLTLDDDFLTMTSEGCWYYFLDKPCPTRFPLACFAATQFYQHEVVEDLKQARVKFILYRNNSSASRIYGFSAEVRQPIIVDYIKQHYRFYTMIDDNELWIKVENPEKAAQGPS